MSVECVTLRDDRSGAQARILAGFGLNCFSWTVPRDEGALELLWASARFAAGTERASSSGIPILFPFPGRIRGTELLWNGRTYRLAAGDRLGNAIHGLVLDRPWRVVEQSERAVTGEFRLSRDAPDRLGCWPADFLVTVRYVLDGTALRWTTRVTNPDERPLPFGLGAHPYFRLPLGGRRAEECVIELPVRERWELVDMLPTGRRIAVADAELFRRGRRLGDLQLDDVFTGLEFAGQHCTARILDPDSQRRLSLAFDTSFRECVVYTPPHREAICIEPYTCVPGAHELGARGIDAGWRVLEPGASASSEFEMRVE